MRLPGYDILLIASYYVKFISRQFAEQPNCQLNKHPCIPSISIRFFSPPLFYTRSFISMHDQTCTATNLRFTLFRYKFNIVV